MNKEKRCGYIKCTNVIIRNHSKANNKRFCSVFCRLEQTKLDHPTRNRDWQRARQDKLHSKPSSNKIQCLICGKFYRQVGTHITQRHELTAREYRQKYGFDVKRGQLPIDLREIKADKTAKNGTIDNLKKGKKFWFKKGQTGVGIYPRSQQTMERLKKGTKNLKKL